MEFSKHDVTFEVDGTPVAGTLYRPAEPSRRGLVFLGPLTSVKEQVPGNYAAAMAARGFVCLAIDNRHFGQSGGQPRQYEVPARKAEDIRAAAAYLLEREADQVGAVGICAGAGYLCSAVSEEPKIAAFATVAGFFHDAEQQRKWMGEGYEGAIERARAACADYEAKGECAYIPAVGEEGEVAMPLKEAFEYYGTERGAVPTYTNRFAVMSREHTLPYDALHHAPSIEVPTLMVHSEKALAPAHARRFYAGLAGPKRELWVESIGQIDFYDDPKKIEPVADELAQHFSAHLG